MNGFTLAFAIGGIVSFFIGAYFSATDEVNTGIVFMGLGLVLQVTSLARIKAAKKRAEGRNGGNAR